MHLNRAFQRAQHVAVMAKNYLEVLKWEVLPSFRLHNDLVPFVSALLEESKDGTVIRSITEGLTFRRNFEIYQEV